MLGSLFSILLVYGAWRFTRGTARPPRAATLAVLAILPLRILAYPLLPELANRALGSVACTVCVALSCALFLRPVSGKHSSSAQTLAFTFPTIAIVSWVDALSPELGIPLTTGIGLWFIAGVVIAAVKISAFLSLQRKRATSLHEQLSSHYREITDTSTDLISEIGEDGTILYANPAHHTILGLEPADVVGRPGSMIQMAPGPHDIPDPEQTSDRPNSQILVFRHRDDGRPVTLESSFHPVRHPSGEIRTVITSRDITARAAQERDREALNARLEALVESRTEELRTSLRQLEEANRLASLGTMAAGIAHQINNPIGSIQMGAEFALGSGDDDPARDASWRSALENAVEQAKRCGRIVSNMLQFARNEPTSKQPEDLAAIARHASDLTSRYASANAATLATRGLDERLPVLGSAIELEQALLNIIRNACESSDERHTVEISAEHDEHHAIVRIADDGRGIAQQDIDRVLDPFFTTRLDVGGTGLGLSVAHGVVTDHGGTLTIESDEGVGTTLTVTLPLDKSPVPTSRGDA